MKYIYFDCFSGFTASMAAGALADMTEGGTLLKKISDSLPEISANICEVKRCSMEATLADFFVTQESKTIKTDELLLMCSRLDVGKQTKNKLESFVKIRAGARSIDPAEAEFNIASELAIIVSAAYVFESLSYLGAEKAYVSEVLCSDAYALSDEGFAPITKAETVYICKKHNIASKPSPIESELTSEDGAALLAVLGASFEKAPRGNVIKIGYGAGEKDFDNVPNLVRAVWGEEDGSAILFEAEHAISDMFTEFAAMEA